MQLVGIQIYKNTWRFGEIMELRIRHKVDDEFSDLAAYGNPSSSLLTNTDESSCNFLSSLYLSVTKFCESVVRNFVDNPEILYYPLY